MATFDTNVMAALMEVFGDDLQIVPVHKPLSAAVGDRLLIVSGTWVSVLRQQQPASAQSEQIHRIMEEERAGLARRQAVAEAVTGHLKSRPIRERVVIPELAPVQEADDLVDVVPHKRQRPRSIKRRPEYLYDYSTEQARRKRDAILQTLSSAPPGKGMTAKAISQALNCHESNASVHLRSLERLGRVRQVNKTTPYHFVLGTKPSKGEGQSAAPPPTEEQEIYLGQGSS